MPAGEEEQVGGETADLDLDDYAYVSPLGRRNKLLALLEIVENVVSITLVCVIFAAMITQVVSRRFFEPAPWTDELARYSNITLAAAAAALAMALRAHITVDLIDRWLSPRVQHYLRAATSVFVAAVAGFIVWVSLPYVAGMGSRVSVALQIPIAALFTVTLVCLVLQAVHALAWAWSDIRSAGDPDDPEAVSR